MSITLTVVEGPHQGAAFTFEQHDTFLVGRSSTAHFSLPEKDPYVSRHHFLVEVNPPLCRLLDLGSHNGTLLNGRPVRTADLKSGDEIEIGRTRVRVTMDVPSRAEPSEGDRNVTLSLRPRPEPQTMSLPPRTEQAVQTLPPEVPAPAAVVQCGYRILSELGRGGMGVVYHAVREADGTEVALKTILPCVTPTRTDVERFLREARVLQQLRHRNIVGFQDLGNAGDLLWFAMDFVPGADTSHLRKAEGPLALGRVVGWGCQLLEALAHAHGCGYVHRDVKPANVLITRVEGREEVRLADFGLARTYQASRLSGLTMTGTAGGTPAFMPPEQVLDFRTARPAADQYGAAATLYALLTGSPPHDSGGTTHDVLKKILQSEPVPIRSRRADVPEKLAAAVHRALAKQPEDRFAGAEAFREALLPFRDP
jgi:eukaryotic-like serine/threonine-protein kinase